MLSTINTVHGGILFANLATAAFTVQQCSNNLFGAPDKPYPLELIREQELPLALGLHPYVPSSSHSTDIMDQLQHHLGGLTVKPPADQRFYIGSKPQFAPVALGKSKVTAYLYESYLLHGDLDAQFGSDLPVGLIEYQVPSKDKDFGNIADRVALLGLGELSQITPQALTSTPGKICYKLTKPQGKRILLEIDPDGTFVFRIAPQGLGQKWPSSVLSDPIGKLELRELAEKIDNVFNSA